MVEHPLFDGVQAERLEPFLRQVHRRRIPRGAMLASPGSGPRLLHLVLSGRLRAYQLTHEGRELLLELIEPGGFDGILSMAGRRGHFTEAAADSEVVSLPVEVLDRMVMAEPRVGLNLIRLMLHRLENREEHLEALALHDPSQRLARQLLALGESVGRTQGTEIVIELRLTHQMLADMLGMRRETVTLHLHQLTELGAVRLEQGRFHLSRGPLERVIAGR